ncbi:hypothetical protein [Stenotrophomonas rhizophila]
MTVSPLRLTPARLRLAGISMIIVLSAMHQWFLGRAHPDALYMDSLRLLFQMQQWLDGQLPTLDFWGQASSHRGFVNQLFLLGNIRLFNLDVLLANRLTGAVVTAVAVILVTAWCRDASRRRGDALGVVELAVALVIAALCFSWAGAELFTLDLGLPLWTKNLAFVLYFVVHARLVEQNGTRSLAGMIALSLAGPVIVLIMGMGWNYAFLGAVLGMQLLAFIGRWQAPGRWQALVPSSLLLFAMLGYLASGSITDAAVKGGGLAATAQVPLLLLYSVGSTLGNTDALLLGGRPLGWLAVAGFGVVVAGVVASGAWLRRGAPGSRLPLYLVVYAGLVAASVALARGADGPAAVIASRYYMDFLLGLVGVIWLAAREIRARRIALSSPAGLAFAALLLVVGMGQAWTSAYEWRVSPARAGAFAAMNRALLHSVPDEAAAALLQSPLSHARLGAQAMRSQHLAMFATLPPDPCQASDVAYLAGWNAAEPHGRWSEGRASLKLPSCACEFIASISVPASLGPRTVSISGPHVASQTFVVPSGGAFQASLGSGSGDADVQLSITPTTVPSQAHAGYGDGRTLGVLVSGVAAMCPLPGQGEPVKPALPART